MAVTLLYAVHIIVGLLILSIPFWPIPALKWGLYVPLAIVVLWLVMNGCPLSNMDAENLGGTSFTRSVLQTVWPGVDEQNTSRFVTGVLVAITLVAGLRLQHATRNCRVNQPRTKQKKKRLSM